MAGRVNLMKTDLDDKDASRSSLAFNDSRNKSDSRCMSDEDSKSSSSSSSMSKDLIEQDGGDEKFDALYYNIMEQAQGAGRQKD